MSERRSRLEMLVDVLSLINSNVQKPTRIMYRGNMSWTHAKEILGSLTEEGLVVEGQVKKRSVYRITDRGRKALRLFRESKEMIAPSTKR